MIGKEGLNQNRDSISTWKVAMPTDMDRLEYIKNCYLSGTVTLIDEWGEYKHRVKIGKISLQLIDFPADIKSLGSEVLCVCLPYSGELRVVDVYNNQDQFTDQNENQYRFFKAGDGFAELRIDGSGKMLLSVDGVEDGVSLDISVTNENRTAQLNLNVNGDIIVQNDGTTTLTTSNQIKVQHIDSEKKETSISVKEKEVKIISEGKIFLNDSEEPMLLGTKTVKLLEDVLTQLGKESAGPYPILGQQVYLQLKGTLEDLKSKISFVA